MGHVEDAFRSEIQCLLNKQSIQEVLADYARGIDRCDEDLLRSVYHEDAMDFHGIFDGPASQFIQIALEAQRKKIHSSHLLGQSKIDFVGNGAYVETYFWSCDLTERPLAGMSVSGEGPFITFMSGRYADWFEDRAEGWRIAERKVLLDWVHAMPLECGGLPMFEVFHQSFKSKEDPAYGRSE
ncbi:nuclear transport factor 2 family protein [Parahaliea mediterranea]|uniref:Nuclear transport factor 2 family protein n=1 Tax=Parahaliea mediterranea TaxID=651086 RepID=A0A939DGL7_9GAMM|nr:nuclear transport factor 2 family protein [Parahaliea mediterranea]MBN7797501.1 nuclear transport factor 2 family protein [Parahaliea mediterranea]